MVFYNHHLFLPRKKKKKENPIHLLHRQAGMFVGCYALIWLKHYSEAAIRENAICEAKEQRESDTRAIFILRHEFGILRYHYPKYNHQTLIHPTTQPPPPSSIESLSFWTLQNPSSFDTPMTASNLLESLVTT
jgi:hypothetical protein